MIRLNDPSHGLLNKQACADAKKRGVHVRVIDATRRHYTDGVDGTVPEHHSAQFRAELAALPGEPSHENIVAVENAYKAEFYPAAREALGHEVQSVRDIPAEHRRAVLDGLTAALKSATLVTP